MILSGKNTKLKRKLTFLKYEVSILSSILLLRKKRIFSWQVDQYFHTFASVFLKSSFNMDGLIEYAIPVKGLSNGIHHFQFEIGEKFFEQFESSPVQQGKVDLALSFEKRTDLYIFEFSFSGSVKTECDRCLAGIDLPISGEERLIVKFSFEEEEEEAEVIYINPEAQQFNVARFIYEFIILAIPMIKVYDCEAEEQPPCNLEMLDYLNSEAPSEKEEDTGVNPIWEELKKFDPNKG